MPYVHEVVVRYRPKDGYCQCDNAIGACSHSFDGKPTRIIILGRGMQQLLSVGSYLAGVRYVFATGLLPENSPNRTILRGLETILGGLGEKGEDVRMGTATTTLLLNDFY